MHNKLSNKSIKPGKRNKLIRKALYENSSHKNKSDMAK